MNGITKIVTGLLVAAIAYPAIACGIVGNKKSPNDMPSPPATAPLKQEFYNPFSEIPIKFESELEFIGTTEMEAISQLSKVALSELYRVNRARGFPAFPDGVSSIIVRTEKNYTLPKGNLENMIEGSNRVIEDLKNYLSGVALSWPTIEYVIPKNESEVRQGLKPVLTSDELSRNIRFYLVDDVQNYAEFKVKLRYATQVDEFTIEINLENTVLGEIRRGLQIMKNDKQASAKFKYSNTLMLIEGEGVLSIVPAIKYLHAATLKHLEAHLEKLVQGTSSREEILRASHEASLLNEYVVHGFELAWGDKYRNESPDKDKIIVGGKRSGWIDDPNVQKMAQFIGEKGPEYVLKMYQANPELLILESGVSIR